MSRRIALAVVAGAAAAISFAVVPPALAAGSITVTASIPSDGDLQLSFTATTPISGFTAHILTKSLTDVFDLQESDFTLTSGSTTQGTWTINAPISTSQLTLGTYTVTVDAQDSGGDSATVTAGTLAFLIQPTVTLNASPANLTYSQPTATLTGSVTGLWPDGTSGPLADEPIDFSTTGYYSIGSTVTDAGGNFSVQLTPLTAGTVVASVSSTGLADASSAPVTVTADSAPTQITATVSTTTASYGQVVTVTGTLAYNPGSGFVPLTGMPVDVGVPGYPSYSAPVTDQSGDFATTFTVLHSGAVTVNFNEGQTPDSGYPLLAPATADSAQINVTYPTSITQFAATVNSFGQLSVHGCLDIAGIPAVDELYLTNEMSIQYATSPSGPWQNLGNVSLGQAATGDDISCGITQAVGVFGGTLQVKLASAYYRAYFGGQSDQNYQASASSPVLAAKYVTKVSGLRVSATHVTKGGRITFTGKLLQYTSGWKPLGQQTILIIFRKPGARTWYWIVKTRTNSAGGFRVTLKDTFTATWSAEYEGNATHYYSTGANLKVTVR